MQTIKSIYSYDSVTAKIYQHIYFQNNIKKDDSWFINVFVA